MDVKHELAVFRIVQELINNTIKHADASTIDVKLRYNNHLMALTVSDDGCGFDTGAVGQTGLGLKNIQSRVHMLNGHIKIKSQPDKGTTAVFTMNAISDNNGA